MQKKRSRLDIVADMLTAIRQKQGEIRPTHLMYRSNLAHGQMQGYLKELSEKNLVGRQTRGGKEYISITETGLAFLRKVEEMKEFEKGFALK
jgi:predicted transcriptional regulator